MTMTLNDFWNSVRDKGADYDGMYGEQCVDLVNAYCDKVFGIKGACYGVGYAYEVFTKKERTKLSTWSKATTGEYGDIVVWKKERNGYAGHIAIVKSCDKKTITVYEQNYDGKGKGRKPSLADGGLREHTYDYTNIAGFIKVPKSLRHKIGAMCICSLVMVNATITKDSSTYKDNTMKVLTGSVKKGEMVRCLTHGDKISIIQYGITKEQYATGCIPSTNLILQ